MSSLSEQDTGEFVSVEPVAQVRHFGTEPIAVDVNFGACSETGRVRQSNQDHYVIVRRSRSRQLIRTSLPETTLPLSEQVAYVFGVADGMGGAAFGELASILAIRSGWDLGFEEVKWQVKIDQDELRELEDKMRIALERIDQAMISEVQEEPWLRGMGTTLTIVYTIGLEAVVGHVGDSRIYLIREGRPHRLTRDHTLAQDLADLGAISQRDVSTHHLRHVLTNCIGGPTKPVDPDVTHVRLRDGDRLLVCSDGLTEHVKDDEIAEIASRESDPDSGCRALVNLALERGGKDNVTVVMAFYHVAH